MKPLLRMPITPPSPEATPPVRIQRRPISGVFLLDKPLGLSSNTALQRVRYLFAALKAGHTGTLDPLASGLLPICLGQATRFSAVVLDAPKTYEAQLRLGYTSSTGDGEGVIQQAQTYQGDAFRLQQVLQGFVGVQQQVPPMHSALKHQGQPLYRYARAGIEIERPMRTIRVHALHQLAWQGEFLSVSVQVSKGTYIRVLAEDIGAALGCGAYLSALRRTASGPYHVAQAHTLEQLAQYSLAQRDACLLPADSLLQELPAVALDQQSARLLGHGQSVPLPEWGLCQSTDPGVHPDSTKPLASVQTLRLYGPDRRFLGLGEWHAGVLRPTRLMSE